MIPLQIHECGQLTTPDLLAAFALLPDVQEVRLSRALTRNPALAEPVTAILRDCLATCGDLRALLLARFAPVDDALLLHGLERNPSNLRTLHHLNLERCAVTAAAVSSVLAGCPQLESLHLGLCKRVNLADVKLDQSCPSLLRLDVSGCAGYASTSAGSTTTDVVEQKQSAGSLSDAIASRAMRLIAAPAAPAAQVAESKLETKSAASTASAAASKAWQLLLLFPSLTQLDLSCTRLTDVSDELAKLSKLQQLSLRGNQLTRLPDAMRDLHALTRLDVSGNRLVSLPGWIAGFKQLQYLNARANKLSAVCREIGALSRLQTLDLSFCSLRELPAEISNLHALKLLDLNYNNLDRRAVQLPKHLRHPGAEFSDGDLNADSGGEDVPVVKLSYNTPL